MNKPMDSPMPASVLMVAAHLVTQEPNPENVFFDESLMKTAARRAVLLNAHCQQAWADWERMPLEDRMTAMDAADSAIRKVGKKDVGLIAKAIAAQSMGLGQ